MHCLMITCSLSVLQTLIPSQIGISIATWIFLISTALFHARWYLYRRYCTILTGGAIHTYMYKYRVSQEECAKLRKNVPYVKVYRYNLKHPYPKLNGYGDNGQRKCGLLAVPPTVPVKVTRYPYTAHVRPWEWNKVNIATAM
jgi:hypothetical protein